MEIIFKIFNRINGYLDRIYVFFLREICCFNIGRNCKISRKVSFKGLHGKISIGNNCIIEPYARFKFVQNLKNRQFVIKIESNVFIGYGTIIDGGDLIYIGKNSMIGPAVFITDANHILGVRNIPIAQQGGIFKETKIGENVWIGAHCQILSGSIVGNNSIIAANSTVNSTLQEETLNTGIPAKMKKKLFQ